MPADRSDDPRVVAARDRLATLVKGPLPFDTLEACLLVALEEYPDLDLAREVRRVEAMGEEAARRTAGVANFFARLDAIRVYLFEELRFQGSEESYDDPRNAYLNQVLDRRCGIPLTLSVLYMEVARRTGLGAVGVALPGHFVVRVEDLERWALVDPFGGGFVITEEDCRELVAKTTGRPSLFRRDLLSGADSLSTVVRLLQNLKRVYLAQDDYPRALAAVDRLLLAAPDDPRELRDRGFLLANLGRAKAAVADLEAYLSLAPSAPDAESVRGRLAWLLKKMSGIR